MHPAKLDAEVLIGMNIINDANLNPSVVSLPNNFCKSGSHLFSTNLYLSILFTVSFFPHKDL